MWQLRGWRVPRRAGCSAACRQWQEQTPWDSPVAAWLCARADIATIVAHCNLYTTRNQNTAIGSNHSLQQGKHSHETCISSHRHRSPQTAFLVIQVFFIFMGNWNQCKFAYIWIWESEDKYWIWHQQLCTTLTFHNPRWLLPRRHL